MAEEAKQGYIIDRDKLPENYPTHAHSAEFWEELGRTVATFGFLEEALGKAIFALTATKQYPEAEIEEAYLKWIPTLQKALTDALGSLISSYGKALKANDGVEFADKDEFIADLRAASKVRNALCHGSWRLPNAAGQSVPMFVTHELEIFETPVDIAFLKQVRAHALGLACTVFDSVTHMGWNFPGSGSPGEVIYEPKKA